MNATTEQTVFTKEQITPDVLRAIESENKSALYKWFLPQAQTATATASASPQLSVFSACISRVSPSGEYVEFALDNGQHWMPVSAIEGIEILS